MRAGLTATMYSQAKFVDQSERNRFRGRWHGHFNAKPLEDLRNPLLEPFSVQIVLVPKSPYAIAIKGVLHFYKVLYRTLVKYCGQLDDSAFCGISHLQVTY